MVMVTIHQPMYFPYPGIFNKIKNSDIFVFLDDAQYTRTYYYNRNRIKTPHGEMMLTVPIMKKHMQKLSEVRISSHVNWQEHHLKSIMHMYKRVDYFENYIGYFEKEVYGKKWEYLNDLNIKTMLYVMKELDIERPYYFSSELLKGEELRSTERLVAICKELDADCYLSGVAGKDYIDEKLFKKEKIRLIYQDYKPKEYRQLFPPFIPNLSVIDLLFNMGEKSKEYI